jgi:hypothetical protein
MVFTPRDMQLAFAHVLRQRKPRPHHLRITRAGVLIDLFASTRSAAGSDGRKRYHRMDE